MEVLWGKEINRIRSDHFGCVKEPLRVTILNPRLMLPEGLFAECADVTICAHSGSFAEFYAKKHGISFEKL